MRFLFLLRAAVIDGAVGRAGSFCMNIHLVFLVKYGERKILPLWALESGQQWCAPTAVTGVSSSLCACK